MICSILSTVVYCVGLRAQMASCTSRTVVGPRLHSTVRISSSASVGLGRFLRHIRRTYYEGIRMSTEKSELLYFTDHQRSRPSILCESHLTPHRNGLIHVSARAPRTARDVAGPLPVQSAPPTSGTLSTHRSELFAGRPLTTIDAAGIVYPFSRIRRTNCASDTLFPGFSFIVASARVRLTSTLSTPIDLGQCHVHDVGAGHSIHAEDGNLDLEQFRARRQSEPPAARTSTSL